MMKKLISLIISLIFVASSLWAQTWSEVLTPEIKGDINDICMTSENEVWAVGDEGQIYYTSDGFSSFQNTTLDTDADLLQVFFVDENNGWIGSDEGIIYYTTDKGSNWTADSLDSIMDDGFSFSYFDGLYFVNDTLGFALAGKFKYNYLYKTTDGGENWAIKDSIADGVSSSRWGDIKFYGENNGVVAGNKTGTLRYTTDGGETWMPGDSSVYSGYTGTGSGSVAWLDDSTVVYIGYGMEYSSITIPIYKSTDRGVTWTSKSSSIEGNYDRPDDVYFKDSQNGIAVGSSVVSKMAIIKTSDGGETWTNADGSYGFGLDVITGSGDVLYVLGTSGHILKSEDFGETWSLFYFTTSSPMRSIQVKDNKAYAMNAYSDIYISEDGSGSEWEVISSAGMYDAGGLYFLDDSEGLVVKENRTILKTTDGGSSWDYVLDPVDEPASANLFGGVSFVNDETGYALFSIDTYTNYSLYKTTDEGDTWTAINEIEGPGSFSGGMRFFGENNGFITGPRIKPDTVYFAWIVYTEDGGSTWDTATVQGLPENMEYQSFYDAAVLDDSTAYAVCYTSLFKTTDKGKTWNYVAHGLTPADTAFYRISFNGNYGALANYDGEIYITDDGGSSWTLHDDYYDVYTPYAVTVTEDGDVFVGTSDGHILKYASVTGIDDEDELVNDYSLSQNYPNPFNPTTTISFSIPQSDVVTLKVYNVLGQEVTTLVNKEMTAGTHKINFDASHLASGVYIYSLKAGSYTVAKKMMLMK